MMLRPRILCLVFICCVSCGLRKSSEPVVVHVLRDPDGLFAERLRQSDRQFASTRPHLENGKYIIVATNEGNSYAYLLQRVRQTPPSLLIVNSQSDLPADIASLVQPRTPRPICAAAAYTPKTLSTEEREATEMYLRFLEGHCESQ
jgi:hypothetical protein